MSMSYQLSTAMRSVSRRNGFALFSRFYSSNDSNSAPSSEERRRHVEELSKYYSKDLLESILLTESVVNPKDWETAKLSKVEFGPGYLDDFSKMHPFFDDGVHRWADRSKSYQPITSVKVQSTGDPNESHLIKALTGQTKSKQIRTGATAQIEDEVFFSLGMSREFLSKLVYRPLIQKHVSNTTAKGKIRSLYALVVVGDKNGFVGVGEGRDPLDSRACVAKASMKAIKNMVYIPRLEDRTIFSEINHKYHSTLLRLRPGPPGSGLRVNHYIYEVCQCAGIKDLSGNVYRSRNGMNVVKGFIEALSSQTPPEELAMARGKKIADVRRAYYEA